MEKKVQIPAIGLIVLGILGVLSSLAGLLMHMPDAKELVQLGMDEKAAERLAEAMATGGVAFKVLHCLLGILASGFVAWAGFQMLKLQSWTACVIANILVMVPC